MLLFSPQSEKLEMYLILLRNNNVKFQVYAPKLWQIADTRFHIKKTQKNYENQRSGCRKTKHYVCKARHLG